MSRKKHSFLSDFLNLFFSFLYHQGAYLYELVAFIVSWGQWFHWTEEVLPYLKGKRILEIGVGTGRMQRFLIRAGKEQIIGLDESRQMIQITKERINKQKQKETSDHSLSLLVRARSEHLPFSDESMDSIFTTFPAPFIADKRTIRNAFRCLKTDGVLVILLAATPNQKNLISKVLSFIYRITGESIEKIEIIEPLLIQMRSEGFSPQIHWIPSHGADLLTIVAIKSAKSS